MTPEDVVEKVARVITDLEDLAEYSGRKRGPRARCARGLFVDAKRLIIGGGSTLALADILDIAPEVK